MRRAFLGHVVQHFAKLCELCRQFVFVGGFEHDLAFDFAEVLAEFAEHASHAGVGVQQVGRGVAFEVQHQVEVEAVVAGAVLRQVGVFHRADADDFGDVAQLVFGQFRVLLFHQVVGAFLRFGEQIDQLHGAAVTGLERTAIGAVHGAEAHVFHFHRMGHETGLARHGEHLLEVQGLTLVDEVQRTIGLELAAAVAHGRQVGGGVEVAAVSLDDDHRQRVAVGVLELVEEHALGAVALDQHACGLQVVDHVDQVVVVGAFAHHVGHGQFDVEQFVDLLAVGQRDVLELGPQGQAIGVAGLQLDHQATGAVGELFGFVEALLGGAVEVLQVRQLVAGDRVFLQVSHQHAELGAPVADVVLTDHFVTEEFQYAGYAVANDGRAQVADVHLFGQVRCRQVDHGALRRASLAHANVSISQCGIEAVGQGLGVLEEIDEARAGDFGLGDVLVGRQCGNDFFRQVARLHARRLGQHHGDVAGEVAVLLVAGVFHLDRRRQAFRQHTFVDELGEGLLDQLANGVFHGLLFRPQARRAHRCAGGKTGHYPLRRRACQP
ncbi:hypothetical protein D3C76_854200 [compost metagenome]